MYPDEYQFTGGRKASAINAIDGKPSVGQSGSNGEILNCASTELSRKTKKSRAYQFLRIRLSTYKHIHFVRLWLRDNDISKDRRKDQDGLFVMVSVRIDRSNPTQCGSAYGSTTQGQAPEFRCNVVGQFIWVILETTRNGKSLQVCEVEVFATAGIHTLETTPSKVSFQN